MTESEKIPPQAAGGWQVNDALIASYEASALSPYLDGPEGWRSFTAPELTAQIAIASLARLAHELNMRLELEREAREAAERLATTDMLTGLPNRRALEQDFAHIIETDPASPRRREGDQNPANRLRGVGVVFIDLDRFKYVNDTYDHAAGDRLLANIGKLLRAGVRRDTDRVYRVGGDEFVISLGLYGRPQPDAAIEKRLYDDFDKRKKAAIKDEENSLTAEERLTLSIADASFGICTSYDRRIDRMTLLQAADKAMYERKQARRAARGEPPRP